MNPIDEYIAAQDEAIQPRLNTIRDTIRAALPDAVEKISYQMPTYWKGRNIILPLSRTTSDCIRAARLRLCSPRS